MFRVNDVVKVGDLVGVVLEIYLGGWGKVRFLGNMVREVDLGCAVRLPAYTLPSYNPLAASGWGTLPFGYRA
jgi:hypothetical protein